MVLACALLLAGTAFAGPFALRAPQVAINSSNDGPTADLWDKTADIGGPWASYSETQFRSEQLWSEVWYTGVDVLSTLVLEIAGNAATNTFGVYNIDTLNKLEIFSGTAGPIANQTLILDGSDLKIGLDSLAISPGNLFGFYLEGPGGTFYSQDGLNPSGAAQMLAYFSQGEFLLAWEDLPKSGGAEPDFNDLVVRIKGAAPVPESSTMLLLGAGLLALTACGRRKFRN